MKKMSRTEWREFVRIVNGSDTREEAAEKLGIDPTKVTSMCVYLRAKGVRVKRFRRGRQTQDFSWLVDDDAADDAVAVPYTIPSDAPEAE